MIILDNIIFSAQRAGGISVVWYELLTRLLRDNRFDVRCLEYPGAERNLYRRELHIPPDRLLPAGFPWPTAIQSRLLPRIRLREKTLFHSSYYRILPDKNACNITTVHDFIYEKYVTGIRRILHTWQKSRAILNSRAIICVSENTRRDLLDLYPQLDPARVFVVHNGVSEEFAVTPEAEGELPFPAGSYLLFVGGRGGYKCFAPAAAALKNTGVNLAVVGGPELEASERALLEAAVGRGHFRHLRGISNCQLNFLYNHAAALLYPSAYEGFGIPVIEAQRAGCPVICRDTAVFREVAGGGALFFTDFAEIPDLLNRAAGMKPALTAAGLENSRRFSWHRNYEQTIAVYRQIMEQ